MPFYENHNNYRWLSEAVVYCRRHSQNSTITSCCVCRPFDFAQGTRLLLSLTEQPLSLAERSRSQTPPQIFDRLG